MPDDRVDILLFEPPICTVELSILTPFAEVDADVLPRLRLGVLLRFRLWCFRFFLSALRTARAHRLESGIIGAGFRRQHFAELAHIQRVRLV